MKRKYFHNHISEAKQICKFREDDCLSFEEIANILNSEQNLRKYYSEQSVREIYMNYKECNFTD